MKDDAGWRWFLAASAVGSWIVTEGVAQVTLERGKFLAELRFSDDTDGYMRIQGTVDDHGAVEGIGTSGDPQIEDLDLQGTYSIAQLEDGTTVESLLLNDGWTSVGLTRQRERQTQ